MLRKTDIALVIADAKTGLTEFEQGILDLIRERKLPYLIVYNKTDLAGRDRAEDTDHTCFVSAVTKEGIFELKEAIGKLLPEEEQPRQIVGDLISPGDFVVLVVPIDSAAPKGRLILPQQQTIRDILEHDACSVAVKESELEHTLKHLGRKPSLVITDSQAFEQVAAIVPEDIPLTSFSILFARYKGDLLEEVRGARAAKHLKDGSRVLIAEGCTHHRQCDDIGTVKIPGWLTEYTGKQLIFETSSGSTFPEDLSGYDLIVHCGGCMLNPCLKHHILP